MTPTAKQKRTTQVHKNQNEKKKTRKPQEKPQKPNYNTNNYSLSWVGGFQQEFQMMEMLPLDIDLVPSNVVLAFHLPQELISERFPLGSAFDF